MIPGIGFTEIILIAVIAIVLFGKRLPEVAKNVGKHYGDLKKSLNEIQSTINSEPDNESQRSSSTNEQDTVDVDDYAEPTAPRLEPPKEDDEPAEEE